MMSGTRPDLAPALSLMLSLPYGTVSCLTLASGFAFMNAASHHFSDLSASGRVSGLQVVIVPEAAALPVDAAEASPDRGPRTPVAAAPPSRPSFTNSRRVAPSRNRASLCSLIPELLSGNVTGYDLA